MNRSFKKWDAIRIIRLLAGLAIGVYAISSKDYMFLFLAGILLTQAILNTCGGGGCSVANNRSQVYKDVIKPYKPGKTD